MAKSQDNSAKQTFSMNQAEIIPKIAGFLQAQLDADMAKQKDLEKNQTPKEKQMMEESFLKRKAVIEAFEKSQGECAGFSAMWAYAKKIEHMPNPDKKARDDIEFFHRVVGALGEWDGKIENLDKNVTPLELEIFISNLIAYQGTEEETEQLVGGGQNKFEQVMQDSKGRNLKKEFDEGFVADQARLEQQLQNIVKPGTLIRLGKTVTYTKEDFAGHAMSFYQNEINGPIDFFDSNRGEFKCNSINELAAEMWQSAKTIGEYSGYTKGEYIEHVNSPEDIFKNLQISAYKFSEELPGQNYPSLEELAYTSEDLKKNIKQIERTIAENGTLETPHNSSHANPPDWFYEHPNFKKAVQNMSDEEVKKALQDPEISMYAKRFIVAHAFEPRITRNNDQGTIMRPRSDALHRYMFENYEPFISYAQKRQFQYASPKMPTITQAAKYALFTQLSEDEKKAESEKKQLLQLPEKPQEAPQNKSTPLPIISQLDQLMADGKKDEAKALAVDAMKFKDKFTLSDALKIVSANPALAAQLFPKNQNLDHSNKLQAARGAPPFGAQVMSAGGKYQDNVSNELYEKLIRDNVKAGNIEAAKLVIAECSRPPSIRILRELGNAELMDFVKEQKIACLCFKDFLVDKEQKGLRELSPKEEKVFNHIKEFSVKRLELENKKEAAKRAIEEKIAQEKQKAEERIANKDKMLEQLDILRKNGDKKGAVELAGKIMEFKELFGLKDALRVISANPALAAELFPPDLKNDYRNHMNKAQGRLIFNGPQVYSANGKYKFDLPEHMYEKLLKENIAAGNIEAAKIIVAQSLWTPNLRLLNDLSSPELIKFIEKENLACLAFENMEQGSEKRIKRDNVGPLDNNLRDLSRFNNFKESIIKANKEKAEAMRVNLIPQLEENKENQQALVPEIMRLKGEFTLTDALKIASAKPDLAKELFPNGPVHVYGQHKYDDKVSPEDYKALLKKNVEAGNIEVAKIIIGQCDEKPDFTLLKELGSPELVDFVKEQYFARNIKFPEQAAPANQAEIVAKLNKDDSPENLVKAVLDGPENLRKPMYKAIIEHNIKNTEKAKAIMDVFAEKAKLAPDYEMLQNNSEVVNHWEQNWQKFAAVKDEQRNAKFDQLKADIQKDNAAKGNLKAQAANIGANVSQHVFNNNNGNRVAPNAKGGPSNGSQQQIN